MILDDDHSWIERIRFSCDRFDFLEIEEICDNPKKALDILLKKEIDLIFLDVEMPQMTGIEFLQQAAYHPKVIFTTANKEYALKAFDFQAVDFLEKPFSFDRFEKAVLKAKKEIELASKPKKMKEIYIKNKSKLIRIPLEDILYFENISDYVRIKTKTGQHTIYRTLKSINEKLPKDVFIKVHRSYIVNLSKIVDIEENTLVVERTVIPISKANKPNLMRMLNTI